MTDDLKKLGTYQFHIPGEDDQRKSVKLEFAVNQYGDVLSRQDPDSEFSIIGVNTGNLDRYYLADGVSQTLCAKVDGVFFHDYINNSNVFDSLVDGLLAGEAQIRHKQFSSNLESEQLTY